MNITTDGINIKNLKVVPDERGWLMEILRCDDEVESDRSNLSYERFTRGVEISEIFILRPTEVI